MTAPGTLVQSGPYTGCHTEEAKARIGQDLQTSGRGAPTVSWHLRDWGFSRQRYWGTPIPIIYCDTHGAVPVPDKDLPVTLPDFAEVSLTGEGGAPLSKLPQFVRAPCPTCGKEGRREVETMDTFVDSAWYFARFLSPHHEDGPIDSALAQAWLPIDIYVGGPEHAVMHLLYFRFFTRAMRDLGLLDIDEPARRLLTQGMVNAPAWRCPAHGYRQEVRLEDGRRVCPQCREPQVMAIEKMSKSKYNGVDPMALIDSYGADTARLYVLFAAPPEKDLEWSQEGVDGLHRFVQRLSRLSAALSDVAQSHEPCASMEALSGTSKAVRQALHRTLQRVSHEMAGRNHFNTAIAALMELTNLCYEHRLQERHDGSVSGPVAQELLRVMAQMLAPFAPHIAETLWADAAAPGLVAQSTWPEVDPSAAREEAITLAVQVAGKMRGQLEVPTDAREQDIVSAAKSLENVAKHLANKTLIKTIVVPGRLVNFVVRP